MHKNTRVITTLSVVLLRLFVRNEFIFNFRFIFQPTNFSNPIYDQFYASDNASELLSPEAGSEKKELLRGKKERSKERSKIYLGDEERQPLGGAHSSSLDT